MGSSYSARRPSIGDAITLVDATRPEDARTREGKTPTGAGAIDFANTGEEIILVDIAGLKGTSTGELGT